MNASLTVSNVLHAEHPTLDAIDHATSVIAAEVLPFFADLEASIRAKLPAASDRETRDDEHRRRAVEADLKLLETGLGPHDLVSDGRLEVLRGRQGRRWFLRAQERLDTMRREVEDRNATTWPREFRYTGPRFKAQIDGRYLEPGDVVALNAAQAASWRDRFQPA